MEFQQGCGGGLKGTSCGSGMDISVATQPSFNLLHREYFVVILPFRNCIIIRKLELVTMVIVNEFLKTGFQHSFTVGVCRLTNNQKFYLMYIPGFSCQIKCSVCVWNTWQGTVYLIRWDSCQLRAEVITLYHHLLSETKNNNNSVRFKYFN